MYKSFGENTCWLTPSSSSANLYPCMYAALAGVTRMRAVLQLWMARKYVPAVANSGQMRAHFRTQSVGKFGIEGCWLQMNKLENGLYRDRSFRGLISLQGRVLGTSENARCTSNFTNLSEKRETTGHVSVTKYNSVGWGNNEPTTTETYRYLMQFYATPSFTNSGLLRLKLWTECAIKI